MLRPAAGALGRSSVPLGPGCPHPPALGRGLLLLQNVGLLRHHLALLLLLERNLPLFLFLHIFGFPAPANHNLPRGQIMNPSRRQVENQQDAYQQDQENHNGAQYRAHQVPEGEGQQDAKGSAALLLLDTKSKPLTDHSTPTSIGSIDQVLQKFIPAILT